MGARKDKLSHKTLAELSTHFGVSPAQLQEHEAFENFVFEYSTPNGDKILRVTQASHRSLEDIQAEIDWVRYLAERGVRVARPQPTKGELEIVVSGDGQYLALSWEKVLGEDLHAKNSDALWSPVLYREWGRTVGQLHRLSQDYQTPSDRPVRSAWSDDHYVLNWPAYVGEDHPQATRAWESTIRSMKSLPVERSNYGLVHADLHAKNFFWHQGHLQIFDTDDCQYSWFLTDIASILTSVSLSERAQPNAQEFVDQFFKHFMEGYNSEFSLADEEFHQLPLLLRFRELLIFGALCHRWDFRALSPAQSKLVSRLQKNIDGSR